MCKKAFRATLRREGKPWPVQCPVCGVYLYPSDVLRSASDGDLEPQRAELRFSGDGGLVEATSAALRQLARAADPRAGAPAQAVPEEVDRAAILAEMVEAASQAADTRAPVQAAPRPTRAPVRITPILVIVVVLGLVAVAAWIISGGR